MIFDFVNSHQKNPKTLLLLIFVNKNPSLIYFLKTHALFNDENDSSLFLLSGELHSSGSLEAY